jgi:hypothetical protein
MFPDDPRIHRSDYRKAIRKQRKESKMYNQSIEELVGINMHPCVLQAIDDNSLTALQGLIIQHLTDPDLEYTGKEIAQVCQDTLGQGSKRSVRRVRAELSEVVKKVELERITDIKDTQFTGSAPKEKTDEGITELRDGGWDVTEQLDCVSACSKAPKKGIVRISAVARKKISLFMKWAGQQEWLAYLKGEWVNESVVQVWDIVLPTQDASATLVHNVKVEEYNGIIGVIHSHHDMGHGSEEQPGFSGHDEAFINSNHNVSLLVSTKGIAGHIRVKTPCGAFLRINASVKHMDEVELDEKGLEDQFKGNIQFGNGQYQDGTPSTGAGAGDGAGQDWYTTRKTPTRENYHF